MLDLIFKGNTTLESTILLFVFGFILLIKGGDWFVDAATGIAKRFKVPDFIIGATIVSIGTTLPEVMVSSTAALGGQGGIAYGNAIGSIVCNTALVSALTIAVRPTSVDRRTFRTPIIFFFVAAAFYSFNAYVLGSFSRISGIIMLCIFVAYIAYLLIDSSRAMKRGELSADSIVDGEPENVDEPEEKNKLAATLRDVVILIVGAFVIAVGADLLVDNGTEIAKWMGVPESVIALTFVALGTSLPELATAITSLIKGHGSLSLGNIIGANLFNIVLVSGVSSVLSPFAIPGENTIAGINSSLIVDIPIMLGVMLIMTLPALIRGKLSRWQGILLLAIYVGFCVFQFI